MTSKVYTPKFPKSSPNLVNKSPDDGGTLRHGFDNSTILGYLKVGKRRVKHLEQNRKAIQEASEQPFFYPFSGVVAINKRLDPRDYTGLIKRLKKEFKTLNVDGTAEVEVSKGNVVQLNLIFRHIPADLQPNNFRKLKEALRKITTVKLNQQYKAMQDRAEGKTTIGYFSKLVFWTPENKDIYKSKRALFIKLKKGERIRRFFDFGKFWERKPSKLNDDYKATKQQRQKYRDQYPKAEEAAKEVFRQFPGQYTSKEHIEDQWYKAYTQGSDLAELNKEINDLAEEWHGSTYELADALYLKKIEREYQRQLLTRRGKRNKAPKARKPWTPSDIVESFTIG